MDGAAQEGSTALLLDGLIEVGLVAQQEALRYAGAVGKGGSELNVWGEDVASAGLAQLLRGKRGLDAEEGQVRALELLQVGDDHLLIVPAGLASRVIGSDFENAVVSIVTLGTDGLGQREESVEDVVSADHVGIGRGSEFVGTGGVEVGELATDNALREIRDAWAEAVQGCVDS